MTKAPETRVVEPLPPNVARRWEWHFRTLLSIRDRLRQSRAENALQRTPPGEMDPEDVADLAGIRARNNTAQASAEATLRLLGDVEDAIQRLYRGNFGYCEATGLRIPDDRLRAIPWCRYTVSAEREHEKTALRA